MSEPADPSSLLAAIEPNLNPRYDRKSLTASIFTLLSGSVISQGLTALVLLFAAREIGPEQYGQYASAIVLTTFFSILFSLGLDIWLLREGGAHPEQIGALAAGVLGTKLFLGAIWIVVLLSLSNIASSETFFPEIFRLAAWIVWLDSLLNTFQALFKSAMKNVITSSLMVASDLAWLIGTLILALRGSLVATTFMEVRIFVLAITIAAGVIIASYHFKLIPNRDVFKRILHEFFPYSASELLVLALLRADVLVVTFTLGNAAVGLYAPAVSLINAMYLIPNAVHGVMLPALSNLFANQPNRAWGSARKVVIIQTAVGLMLSIALFFASPLLVGLLGPKYSGSLEIMQILSFNLVFRGLSFAMVAILVATRQQARRAIIQATAVAVNVILNLAVVNWLGIRGVAMVYVITEIVLAGGYTWLVFKQREIKHNYNGTRQ